MSSTELHGAQQAERREILAVGHPGLRIQDRDADGRQRVRMTVGWMAPHAAGSFAVRYATQASSVPSFR
jgi:hypothetical protein